MQQNALLQHSYRALLLFCACYFSAVAIAHQTGWKVPMLFVFYAVPSERYQDLIISFLAFGWAALFLIGLMDRAMKPAVHAPILVSGVVALAGLVRAKSEILGNGVIYFEIAGFAILLAAMVLLFTLITMQLRGKNRQ